MIRRIVVFVMILLVFPVTDYGALADYLLLQDISQYKLSRPEKLIPGFALIGGPRTYASAGIVAGADHFALDHMDTTYEVMYFGGEANASPTVQVTQHANSDSDKWLLHEVEKSFRDADDEDARLGLLHKGSRIIDISDSKIFRYWSTYRWISNNVAIVIDYNDPRKPEPTAVVQAYIQKFPSTIPSTFVLDSAHDVIWIKDEMDRRLWLCDKWFMQLQLKKAEEKDVYREVVKSMTVFLNYRERYYGIKAEDERNLLEGYRMQNNGTGIKAKLKEYKDWWAVNKGKKINI